MARLAYFTSAENRIVLKEVKDEGAGLFCEGGKRPKVLFSNPSADFIEKNANS